MSLLQLEAVLKERPLAVLSTFFKKLSVVQRARWRWCFPEPANAMGYPRQRAKFAIIGSVQDWEMAEQLSIEQNDRTLPPHNRTSPVFKVGARAAVEWGSNCLTTTNIDYNQVRADFHDAPSDSPDCSSADPFPAEPWTRSTVRYFHRIAPQVPPAPQESSTSFNSLAVWLKMIKLAHSEALLRPGAMAIIEAWAQRSTERQRSAVSNIFLLFTDFLATGGSALMSETKIKYGPKAIQPREAATAGMSTLGRPSTAPIVSAVQKKLEEKLRAEDEAAVRRAEDLMAKRMQQGLRASASRSSHPAYGSSIPMKWPMKATVLMTTSQAAQLQVKAGQMALTMPSESSNPPASAFNRCMGMPRWHGDAHYPRFLPIAHATYDSLVPLTPQTRPMTAAVSM